MGFFKKHWLIDISLIVIIIVMGVFVVLELRRTFSLMRQQVNSSPFVRVELTPESEQSNSDPDVIVDEPASPEEQPYELIDLDGEDITLSAYEGTPLLVNFWATWCPPCLEEMSLIQEYADRYEGDLVVLAINAGEDLAIVRDFIDRHQLRLIVLLDPSNTVSRHYRVFGFPTTLFFDDEGTLVSTHIGELNAALLDRYLLKIGLYE